MYIIYIMILYYASASVKWGMFNVLSENIGQKSDGLTFMATLNALSLHALSFSLPTLHTYVHADMHTHSLSLSSSLSLRYTHSRSRCLHYRHAYTTKSAVEIHAYNYIIWYSSIFDGAVILYNIYTYVHADTHTHTLSLRYTHSLANTLNIIRHHIW